MVGIVKILTVLSYAHSLLTDDVLVDLVLIRVRIEYIYVEISSRCLPLCLIVARANHR